VTPKVHVLITNHGLQFRGGSELYTKELAIGLRARGVSVAVYAPRLGEVADEIAGTGIPVVSDLRDMTRVPDLIHGHHYLPTLAAIFRFRATPALFVCHGIEPWQELPPVHPAIVRYYAVGPLTAQHVCTHAGVTAADVTVIPNWVNIELFRQKETLREVPREALIVHNGLYLTVAIERACRDLGMSLRKYGRGLGETSNRLDVAFQAADIVFATGKTAIEAMASGCGVILAGEAGISELILPQNFESYRGKFGIARLRREWLTPDKVRAQIEAYDADAVRRVSNAVREAYSWDQAIDRWMVEHTAIAGSRVSAPGASSGTAAYLQQAGSDLRANLTMMGRAGKHRLERKALRMLRRCQDHFRR
jgi:glycosyltransferase involved in cell wall biosynthesis